MADGLTVEETEVNDTHNGAEDNKACSGALSGAGDTFQENKKGKIMSTCPQIPQACPQIYRFHCSLKRS